MHSSVTASTLETVSNHSLDHCYSAVILPAQLFKLVNDAGYQHPAPAVQCHIHRECVRRRRMLCLAVCHLGCLLMASHPDSSPEAKLVSHLSRPRQTCKFLATAPEMSCTDVPASQQHMQTGALQHRPVLLLFSCQSGTSELSRVMKVSGSL